MATALTGHRVKDKAPNARSNKDNAAQTDNEVRAFLCGRGSAYLLDDDIGRFLRNKLRAARRALLHDTAHPAAVKNTLS